MLLGGSPMTASNDEIKQWIGGAVGQNPIAAQTLNLEAGAIKGVRMKLAVIPCKPEFKDNTDKVFDTINTLKLPDSKFNNVPIWIGYEKPPHIRDRNSKLQQARQSLQKMGANEGDILVRFSEHYIEYKGDVVAHFNTKLKRGEIGLKNLA